MTDLYNSFIAEENFIAAYNQVAAKGSRGGVDGVSVAEFGHGLKRHLGKLRREIEGGAYVPQPVEAVAIPKFNAENEWRELGLPTVADKVVQAALLRVVEPLAEKLFLDSSYAYRKGKGHTRAVRRVEHYLTQERRRWAALQDIDNFFDTLDHDRLLDAFSRLVNGDERLVTLVTLWCRSGIVARDGHWKNVEAGVRQGQIISPLLANLYLHPLDEFARSQGWGWIRYADNYLILETAEESVRLADQQATEFVETLRLRLNRNDTPVRSLDAGFVFLGVEFCGLSRAIAPEKMEKIKRKLDWTLSPKANADLAALFKTLTFKAEGWRRYYGFLKPSAQFAEIEQWMDTGLTTLIAKRVSDGVWPREAPEGIVYPRLSAGTQPPEDNRKRLGAIWAKGIALIGKETRQKADKLVSGRRKRHQREQVATGELIVTTPGHFIGRRGERIVVRKQQTVMSEIIGMRLQSITIASHGVSISSDVIHYCASRDIFINCIDPHGRIIAVTHKPDGVRAELAFLQARERDTAKGQQLARYFVTGKMKNQMALLKSYAKYGHHRRKGFSAALAASITAMQKMLSEAGGLGPCSDAGAFRQHLMGLEGIFGAMYWKLMSTLLPEDIIFVNREHQGATDLVNSLLNYGYGILYSQVTNAVTKVGLNAQAGFLHAYQPGKPVLVYDLVEEFRAPAVDRPVFSMLNRREPFRQTEDGLLSEESRKKLAAGILSRLGAEVVHQGRRQTIREVLGHQAMAVRRYLLGQARYRPFHAKW